MLKLLFVILFHLLLYVLDFFPIQELSHILWNFYIHLIKMFVNKPFGL